MSRNGTTREFSRILSAAASILLRVLGEARLKINAGHARFKLVSKARQIKILRPITFNWCQA
jgi:hypothetical protein